MTQDENDDRSERYKNKQEDGYIVRKQLDILSGKVGELSGKVVELVSALKGDGFGNDGIVKRQTDTDKEIETFKIEMAETISSFKIAFNNFVDATKDELRKVNAKKDKITMYLILIVGLGGTLLGIALTGIYNYFLKK